MKVQERTKVLYFLNYKVWHYRDFLSCCESRLKQGRLFIIAMQHLYSFVTRGMFSLLQVWGGSRDRQTPHTLWLFWSTSLLNLAEHGHHFAFPPSCHIAEYSNCKQSLIYISYEFNVQNVCTVKPVIYDHPPQTCITIGGLLTQVHIDMPSNRYLFVHAILSLLK